MRVNLTYRPCQRLTIRLISPFSSREQVLQCLDRLQKLCERCDQRTLLARVAGTEPVRKVSGSSSPVVSGRSNSTPRPWLVRHSAFAGVWSIECC